MSNESILVSVVVPVYNVRKYLPKLITTVQAQTHSNFELILVDDGSEDGSSALLDEISKSDERLIVIHKENGGVSSARNAGINVAKGEYIIFIDGDDWVDNNHIEYLLSVALKFNVPVVYGIQHYLELDDRENNQEKESIVDSEQIIRGIYECKIYMAVWNRIYSRKFLNENNIRFNENIWYSEGMHFNMQCLSKTDKVAIAPKKTYHYINNSESVMRKCFKLENELNALKSLEDQKRFFDLNNKKNVYAHTFHLMVVHDNICKGIVTNNLINNYAQQFKESVRFLHKHWLIPFKINIRFKQKIRWLLVTKFTNLFGKHFVWKKKNKVRAVN